MKAIFRFARHAAVAVALLSALTAMAQRDRASITGLVKDPSGAAIPGVSVTVTSTETKVETKATTDGSGFYRIFNLPIGTYTTKFERPGFSSYTRNEITLVVSQVAEIDATLKVGGEDQAVTVTTAEPLLQTETSNLQTTLTNDTVTNMPLSISGGRTLSSFMFAYVPGVEGSDYTSHINGSQAMSKEVMIDGTSAVSQLGGYLSESQPPMEAVDQFQVETAGIGASAGRTGGGVFKYEMKSGTNSIHGAVFGFLRNSIFDANSWVNKYQRGDSIQKDPTNSAYYNSLYKRPSDNMSQWGLGVGGPLIKDKLFWYGAYERYQFNNYGPGGLSGIVPNASFLNGDLSALLVKKERLGTDPGGHAIYKGAIFDPTTGNVFDNNQIPTTRFSAVSQKIISIYKQYYAPVPSEQPQNNMMPANPLPWQHINMVSGKIDYNFSAKNRFTGSYIYNSSPRILADQGGIWSYTAQNGGPLANSYTHFVHAPSARLAWFYTKSDHLLNTLRFTFNRFYNPSIAISKSDKWDQQLGLGDFGSGNFPKITFAGSSYNSNYNMSPIGSQFNDYYAANTFIWNDDVTWVVGRNTVTFGGEFRAMQFNSHADEGVLNLSFDPSQTGDPNASYATNVGSAWASFLLGAVNGANVPQQNWLYGRRKTLSFYATDDFKATSKLTFNVDVRWDWNSPYKEKNGHWANYNPDAANAVTGIPGAVDYLDNGGQSFTKKQVWTNFAPHFGIAYQATPRTVVRGSFSVFYTPINMNSWGAVPYSFDPGYITTSQILSTGQRQSTWQNWDTSYGSVASVIPPSKDPNFLKWGMTRIDPRMQTPGNTQQYLVGVQQSFGKQWVASVDFIANQSYHLQTGYLDGNQPAIADYQALAKKRTQYSWVSDPTSAAAAGVPYPYAGFAGPAYMAITPNPHLATSYGPMFVVGAPVGNATYNSMQFQVRRSASNGLSVMASYVLSRSRGDADSSFQEAWSTGTIQNIYDRQRERNTISSFDQTHVVKGYASYILPFGRGRFFASNVGRFTDLLVNNWMLNGDFHYASGTPVYLHSQNVYPGLNSVYVNVVPGCNQRTGTTAIKQDYFNKACFSNPNELVGELGNGDNYLSSLRAPGTSTEDFSIIKAFAFGDRYKVSLRGDFFNIFNRRSYAAPDTSMTSSTYGQITAYPGPIGPRTGQVGARISF